MDSSDTGRLMKYAIFDYVYHYHPSRIGIGYYAIGIEGEKRWKNLEMNQQKWLKKKINKKFDAEKKLEIWKI